MTQSSHSDTRHLAPIRKRPVTKQFRLLNNYDETGEVTELVLVDRLDDVIVDEEELPLFL